MESVRLDLVLGRITGGLRAVFVDLFLADVAITALPVFSVCDRGGDVVGVDTQRSDVSTADNSRQHRIADSGSLSDDFGIGPAIALDGRDRVLFLCHGMP